MAPVNTPHNPGSTPHNSPAPFTGGGPFVVSGVRYGAASRFAALKTVGMPLVWRELFFRSVRYNKSKARRKPDELVLA